MTAVAGQRVIAIAGPLLVFVVHPQAIVLVTHQTGEHLEGASLVTRGTRRAVRSRRDWESMVERGLIPRRVRGSMAALARARESRCDVAWSRGSVVLRAVTSHALARGAEMDVVDVTTVTRGLGVPADQREYC